MALTAGTRLGPYEILSALGAGGMGEVYRARDPRLGRELAIKVIPGEASTNVDRLARFEKEARLASALNHPNIVTIYDIGSAEAGAYIAMELVDGRTLRSTLTSGPLARTQLFDIALQLAEGLAKAHEAGIVHRDLKPENVMMTRDGLVKILDFGLGKLEEPPDPALSHLVTTLGEARTAPGTILGTVNYMSPEQASGRPADFRSDQFAFGSIFYEMATGKRAFVRPTTVQTLSAIIEASPEPVEQVNDAAQTPLQRILYRCLAKNPDDRYASTRDLVLDLQNLLPGRALDRPRRRVGLFRQVRQPARRWAAVVLVAAAAVAGSLLFGRPSHQVPLTQAASLPEQKSIVVLPFEVVGERGVHYRAFADGLAAAVTLQLTLLTTSHSLQVAPAGEVKRRAARTAADARRLLGANLVLSGRLEERGDSLRLTWTLNETATGQPVQQKTVSVPAADPLSMEARITESVLEVLNLELAPAEREALFGRDTLVAAAKELYLQARGYLQDFDRPENVERAIALFADALKSDRQYAAAYAGLGEAYGYKLIGNAKDAQWIDAGQEACQQAIQLNPRLASAHACLATFALQTGRYEAAVREFEQAIEIEPTRDEFYRELARAHEKLGNVNDAEKTLRRAIAIRPHYWANYNLLGSFYFNAGRYAEAVEMFTRVVSLAPDTYFGHANLGGAHLQMGRYDEAITVLDRAVQISPTANAYSNLATALFNRRRFLDAAHNFEEATKVDEKNYAVWGNLGDAYHWAPGQRPRAADAYRRAIALGRERLKMNARDATLLARLAGYHAMLSERGSALECLRQALAIGPRDGAVHFKAAIVHNQFKETDETLQALERAVANSYSVTIIRDAPNFDPLWVQTRFQNLLRSR